MGTPIRVAIATASPLSFEGLSRILIDDPTLFVIPAMMTADELSVRVDRGEADVVLIHAPDGPSPGTWGLLGALCQRAKVILLLRQYHPTTVTRALTLGVLGIATEEIVRSAALAKAVQEVAAGSVWCEPGPGLPGTGSPEPSEREADVLALIRTGCSNREIANRLCISERTVKSHVNRLLQKFRVKNRVQLALYSEDRASRPTS